LIQSKGFELLSCKDVEEEGRKLVEVEFTALCKSNVTKDADS